MVTHTATGTPSARVLAVGLLLADAITKGGDAEASDGWGRAASLEADAAGDTDGTVVRMMRDTVALYVQGSTTTLDTFTKAKEDAFCAGGALAPSDASTLGSCRLENKLTKLTVAATAPVPALLEFAANASSSASTLFTSASTDVTSLLVLVLSLVGANHLEMNCFGEAGWMGMHRPYMT